MVAYASVCFAVTPHVAGPSQKPTLVPAVSFVFSVLFRITPLYRTANPKRERYPRELVLIEHPYGWKVKDKRDPHLREAATKPVP